LLRKNGNKGRGRGNLFKSRHAKFFVHMSEDKKEFYRNYLRSQGFTDDEIDKLWGITNEIVNALLIIVKLLKTKREISRPDEAACCSFEVVFNTIVAILEQTKKVIWHKMINLFFFEPGPKKKEDMYA
jgi:hypothetical protein